MRPESIHLKGVGPYADMTLPLHDLGEGLIAIVGATGGGKTMLMDGIGGLLGLWREFSTRDGGLRDWCTRRDACVDYTFTYQGARYRSLLNIDPDFSAGAGKTEAYLYREGPGGWETLTPGRVTDFEELVKGVTAKPGRPARRGIFPPLSVYKAAAYSAQDKGGNFFALAAPERKALFAELIGLEEYQRRSERAGAARKILDATMRDLDQEVARVLADWNASKAIAAQVTEAEAALAPLVAAEAQADAALHAATDAGQRAVGLLQTLDAARAAALQRIAELDTEEREATASAARHRARIEAIECMLTGEDQARADAAALVTAQAAAASAETDWRAANAVKRAAIGTRDGAITARDRARQDRDRATATIAEASRAAADLATAEARIAPLAGLRVEHTRLDGIVRAEEAALAPMRTNARAEASAADMRLADARRALDVATGKADLLHGVPCRGEVMVTDAERVDCGACRFLTDARAAAGSVAGLNAKLPSLEAAAADALAALQAVQDRDAELGELRAERDRVARERDALAPGEAAVARLRALTAGTDAARAALADAEARVAALDGEITAAEDAVAAAVIAEADVTARGQAAAGRVDALKGVDVRLREIEAAAAQLPLVRENLATDERRAYTAHLARAEVKVPADPETERRAADAADARTREARQALAAARQATQAGRSALDVLRGQLRQLGDVEARRSAIEARRQKVAAYRSGFVLIEQAFGRDGGIQTLEMDAAGPEVSNLCNQILASCFDDRFTIRMRTIREAEGQRRQLEVFDVEVFDGRRGGKPGPFKGLSGGEQALVGAAFRFALAVFNARRHGDQFASLFVDEMDQGLDPNLVSRYPEMLRRVRELGGFERVFYIAHPEAAWSQADSVIRVEGGRAWIER